MNNLASHFLVMCTVQNIDYYLVTLRRTSGLCIETMSEVTCLHKPVTAFSVYKYDNNSARCFLIRICGTVSLGGNKEDA